MLTVTQVLPSRYLPEKTFRNVLTVMVLGTFRGHNILSEKDIKKFKKQIRRIGSIGHWNV